MELIVIAAGKGSRFTKAGIHIPKPLVSFNGQPLFWWATQSALSSCDFSKIHFAILQEHINNYSIDNEILTLYPEAQLHVLDQATSGAAETAALVAENLEPTAAIAFVDCDLAFNFKTIHPLENIKSSEYEAALCLFESNNPGYSYAIFSGENTVVGTIEKKVASSWAICGLYAFKSAKIYLKNYFEYKKYCPYSELFLSGIINCIASNDGKILPIYLSSHLSLGTPNEINDAIHLPKDQLPSWDTYKS